MSIAQIRAGLETMLLSAGMRSASAYPTENVGTTPFAFVGFDDDTPLMGNKELHLHTLPITVLVERKGGNLPNQVKAVEAALDTLMAAIRVNQTLGTGDLVSRVQPVRIQEGVYAFGGPGMDYVGAIVTVEVKETFAATYGDG